MSHFTRVLCRDVRVCFFAFLGPKDQARLRAVSKETRIDFNHAAQRGYVPVMVCDEYVEDVNEIHQDGEGGNPKLSFAPGDHPYKMQRSENDRNATLIVNVAKILGKGETNLQDRFLYAAQFKAVHLIGMENLEEIGVCCLQEARNLFCFTMSTPCPKLRSVGDNWLCKCPALSKVSFSGCTALESVGNCWLYHCSYLQDVAFAGCSALENVGGHWLRECTALEAPDFSSLVSLKHVGRYWLYGCSSLKITNFAGCSALEQVDQQWMRFCAALEVSDLSACVALQGIGKDWLRNCASLRRVVLPPDTKLPDDMMKRVKKYLE